MSNAAESRGRRRDKVVTREKRRTWLGGKSTAIHSNQDRKLSEISKEMALRLLNKPGDPPSLVAFGTVFVLGTAAWNAAVGDSDLQHQHRELLKNQDWSDGEPWATT